MKKCLNQDRKSIFFIHNLTKIRLKIRFDLDMRNIGSTDNTHSTGEFHEE